MLCCGQFIFRDGGDVVLVEEAGADNFLALGEMQGIYCPATIEEGDKRGEEKWIRVQLWLVTRPDTPLPVSVSIDCGGVICTTLGEAYENNIG
jgi:hypothetical protein